MKKVKDKELKKVTGGQVEVNGDVAPLKFAGKSVPLPPAKSKKLIDGGYEGKVVTFGIRPEDVYDSEM